MIPAGRGPTLSDRGGLFLKGRATKTDARHSVAKHPHDRQRRLDAKKALKHRPVRFTGRQALAIGHGFIRAIEEAGYVIVACSILHDHVHIVVLRHYRTAERMIGHLKSRATQALVDEGLHPFVELRDENGRFPSVWARRGWKVFLDSERNILRAIDYVEKNPEKERLPRQRWSFVKRYPSVASRKRDR